MSFSGKVHCESYTMKSRFTLTDMKFHVFISKQTTASFADFVEKESWGQSNILLYKYLDYMWRLQIIDKQVKIFYHNNEERLVFNTGLYKRYTNEEVYLYLIPNQKFLIDPEIKQKWRVCAMKSVKYCINDSFVTGNELIHKHGLRRSDIPRKTSIRADIKDRKFNPNYSFVMNLTERVRTTKSRIMTEIKRTAGDTNISDEELTKMVKQSITSGLDLLRNNPSLIGHQMFIERNLIKNNKIPTGYHLELIMPLKLSINNEDIYFVLALRGNHVFQQYEGMSIITLNMAYINSRLTGKIQAPWLKNVVKRECKLYDDSSVLSGHSSDSSESPKITQQHQPSHNQYSAKKHQDFYLNENTYPLFYLATVLPVKLPPLNPQLMR
mmetsp:Transcript_101872/g.124671  ORF Transcript_101872/g.124671 Transcript_101872/m.124671 type:complete len:382 (+) Transcript_101872:91-1236(+)